mmetsp:Transcript_13203/g.22396  ORF Transcript_13203/g.22396 Transcript_13203/m.22396 type:complete len:89 (+) Transcript_13203:62-328(+)
MDKGNKKGGEPTHLVFQDKQDVYDLQKKMRREEPNTVLLIYKGLVYDSTEYLQAHPGGDRILMKYAGKSIDQAIELQGHSDSAYYIMS